MTLTVASTTDEAGMAAAAHARACAQAAPGVALQPAVAAAVTDLETRHPGHLQFWADGNGGAHVFLDNLALGAHYSRATTWMAFHIANSTPNCDVYPHWIRGDLARTDGGKLVPPLHSGNSWLGLPATMVSLASNKRDPLIDTPALKVTRVLAKIRSM